jgi:tetratricopeptide (TPR) repeat protein
MAGTFNDGLRYFRLKRWDLALREFLSVKEEGPDAERDVELAYFLGLCYTKMGAYDDALLYLEQVVTSSGNPLRVYQCRLTLAYIYTITNRSKMAEFELDSLQKSGFESPQVYTTMAYAAWQQKQYERAVDLYEKALKLDQNNLTALNGLGYILADRGIDIKRGLGYCRIIVERKPQNPAYLDSLGWANYKNGDLIEARNCLRRALDLSKHPEIREHMKVVVRES